MTVQTAAHMSTSPSAIGIKLVAADTAENQLVGVNPAWRKLLIQAEVVAPYVQVAAIEGEPGTGKQTLARFLHSLTPLARSPFVRRDVREWLVTEADPSTLNGFLYLDRVDLLGTPGQGLLLSVLKALQDSPLGRPQDKLVLVVSSQISLRQMASQGQLLPDLAFRLTGVRFAIPPLRQRREDIAPLAQALLERICTRYQLRPVVLGPGALVRLLQHAWPGNIRELSSVLEAALLEAGDAIIRAEDLLLPMHSEAQAAQSPVLGTPPANLVLDSVIQQHVQYVLDLNRGNKLRAARQLGISRSTLYRILGNDSFMAK